MTTTEKRKQSHLSICVNEDVAFKKKTTLFEEIELVHCALPELNLDDIDSSVKIFGKTLQSPLIIGAMTGGAGEREKLNQNFAKAAAKANIGFSLGSIRPALENPKLIKEFSVRDTAPDILLFSNIGGNQLAEFGAKKIIALSKKIGADAVTVHLNAAMELIQPGGDTAFAGILEQISHLVDEADSYPVTVKAIGMGLSYNDGILLKKAGVSTVETAGAGGTSWIGVETLRSEGMDEAIGNVLWDFGIPTAVTTAWMVDAGFKVISSGGISNSLDMAKALSLGADLTAIARPMLQAVNEDPENGLDDKIRALTAGLKYVMMCCGAGSIKELATVPRVIGGTLSHYIETGWTGK
jgi:isopentenyl-diphosphate delta-isomerase